MRGDVLIDGKKILAIGPSLSAGGADVIDARGKIVMPGFIDTHHHQAWTAIRSSIPDSILIDDGTGTPSAQQNYFGNIAAGVRAGRYRPQDVYISELFGGLSQLDNGVTTVHDISQIHHSPQHSDAAIKALFDAGRRAAFGYFESAGADFGRQPVSDRCDPHQTALVLLERPARPHDHGRRSLSRRADPTRQAWTIGRQLGLQVAAHILSPFGMRPILDDLAAGTGGTGNNIGLGSDNLFIHMTGMSDFGWQKVKEKGVQVSIAFPIEMNMRHGIPPILKMQQLGMEPSLSSDVETNMTACFFTQMRSAMTMQRMVVNQMILELGHLQSTERVPPGDRTRRTCRGCSMCATCCATPPSTARSTCGSTSKTGSLKPGKEADIIILDATHLNVFPVNHVPGAVVQMMDRSNVETVIVAGKVRKWKGKLLDVDLNRLRDQLEDFARLHLPDGRRAAEPVPLRADRIAIAGRLRPPRIYRHAGSPGSRSRQNSRPGRSTRNVSMKPPWRCVT